MPAARWHTAFQVVQAGCSLTRFLLSPDPELSNRTMLSFSSLTVSAGVLVFDFVKKFIAAVAMVVERGSDG